MENMKLCAIRAKVPMERERERSSQRERKWMKKLENVKIAFWAHILFVIFSISHRHTYNSSQSQFILKHPCAVMLHAHIQKKVPMNGACYPFAHDIKETSELWHKLNTFGFVHCLHITKAKRWQSESIFVAIVSSEITLKKRVRETRRNTTISNKMH